VGGGGLGKRKCESRQESEIVCERHYGKGFEWGGVGGVWGERDRE